MTELPDTIDVKAFDELHDDPARWQHIVASIAAAFSDVPIRPVEDGTALVALVGETLVVKLYPPFLRDHFEFECAAMERLCGRLAVPTPRLVASGERDGWPWLVMTQLVGVPLGRVWPELDETRKCAVLRAIGSLAAEVHALPVGDLAERAPDWHTFLQSQRARCRHRQQRTGLPAHLLERLEPFLEGDVPAGPAVILTGEYSPENLLHGPAGIVGMFDFGDGLVGPREYDWLGPLCFLAAGHAARCDAFFAGYGLAYDRRWRQPLLRLLLLHRYSHLRIQIAHPGWETAATFEELAALIWP